MPDLHNPNVPKRSRKDSGWNIPVMIETPETTLQRYNARGGGHLASRKLVGFEWNYVINEGVGMGSIGCRGFIKALQ
jgi:hypothetical protein